MRRILTNNNNINSKEAAKRLVDDKFQAQEKYHLTEKSYLISA
jgi:hypothetical protein